MCFCAGLVLCAPLHAADLQISPTKLHFKPQDRSQLLWLINSGAEPLRAQVRLFQWTQSVEEDLLEPSHDLALSPAMVTVAPGDRQLIRVIRREAASLVSAGAEKSYRIYVDELPIETPSRQQAVRFVFRYSLPVFLASGHTEQEGHNNQLVWMYKETPQGPKLRVLNQGDRHAQIAGLSLVSAEQQVMVKKGLFGYVLAGAVREWTLPIDSGSKQVANGVQATINGERIESSFSAWPASP